MARAREGVGGLGFGYALSGGRPVSSSSHRNVWQVLAGEYDESRVRGEMEALNKANAVVVYAQVRRRLSRSRSQQPTTTIAAAASCRMDGHARSLISLSRHHAINHINQVTCPFCTKAKELLTSLGAKYKVVEVDALGKEGFAYRVELSKMTGRSTVPNIFVGGKAVGGFTDGVEELHKAGKLVPLLKEAGAL